MGFSRRRRSEWLFFLPTTGIRTAYNARYCTCSDVANDAALGVVQLAKALHKKEDNIKQTNIRASRVGLFE